MKPSKKLYKLYERYNREFFDGRLPKDTQLVYNENLEDKYALTVGVTDEETQHTFFVIYFHPGYHASLDMIKMSVLHEMCHVALHPYMKHGRKFQEEMKRLAMRDAFEGIW